MITATDWKAIFYPQSVQLVHNCRIVLKLVIVLKICYADYSRGPLCTFVN